ncbi:peptidylprolyl isomerase [Sporosarcina sp. 179-K 3D1 HS]|uniref:peptidylprolyl isomerase n=1 Tax=Sporosarcina sp. 179-K 3D1 HS TaxID=3232169 RepID=UPI00399F48CC
MRKKVIALSMAASVLALSACSGNKASDDEIIVKSKAGNVTKEELYQEMKDVAGQETLQLLVIEKVLDAKYDVSDEQVKSEIDKMKEQLGDNFEAYLAQQGQTEASVKKIIKLNLLQEAALSEGVEVTDEELDQRIEMMNTELKAKHILVDDEETALKVKKKVEEGADFAATAKEFSTEPAAKESGGDLGWFGYGKMVPEFWDAAYGLELNKLSDPVQTEHGYHIIEVTEKRKAEDAKEYSKEEKEELRKEMKLEKADQSAAMEKISNLMKEADVKVEDQDLKSALDMFIQEENDKKEETKEESKEETPKEK